MSFQMELKQFFLFKNDLKSLNIKEVEPIFEKFELEVFENLNDDNLNIRVIDRSLKKRFFISQKQRVEILSQKNITISHKINISISENYIYIAQSRCCLEKEFKSFAGLKIPQNIRGYIF